MRLSRRVVVLTVVAGSVPAGAGVAQAAAPAPAPYRCDVTGTFTYSINGVVHHYVAEPGPTTGPCPNWREVPPAAPPASSAPAGSAPASSPAQAG